MTLMLTSHGPHMTLMLTSPGPHMTLMITSPGSHVIMVMGRGSEWIGSLLRPAELTIWPSSRSGDSPTD